MLVTDGLVVDTYRAKPVASYLTAQIRLDEVACLVAVGS